MYVCVCAVAAIENKGGHISPISKVKKDIALSDDK